MTGRARAPLRQRHDGAAPSDARTDHTDAHARRDVRQHLLRMRLAGNLPGLFRRFHGTRARPFSHSENPAAPFLPHPAPRPTDPGLRDPERRASGRNAMAPTSGRAPVVAKAGNQGRAFPRDGNDRCGQAPSNRQPTGQTGRYSLTYRPSMTANGGTDGQSVPTASADKRGSAPCRRTQARAGNWNIDVNGPSSSSADMRSGKPERQPRCARAAGAGPDATGSPWTRLASGRPATYPQPWSVCPDAATLPPQTGCWRFR